MWNCKADLVRRGENGWIDGTPVYGLVVVYAGVNGRLDVVPTYARIERGKARIEHSIRKVLMIKPNHNGQVISLDYDMHVVINGKEHDIQAINPLGPSYKPLWYELTINDVVNV